MEAENKLVPVLRGGVEVIKMIFFKKLKDTLSKDYPDKDNKYISRLSAAILNELFGTPNPNEPFVSFARENRRRIDAELRAVPIKFKEMRIPLTDALRIQFLCDSMEGIDSKDVLENAKDLGILMVEREVPLPKNFMNLVRRLGSAFQVITPAQI